MPKTVILAVDVQNDFVEGGALGVEGGKHVAEIIQNELLPLSFLFGMPFLYTKDWHVNPGEHFASNTGTEPDFNVSWPDHCVAESDGAAFAADFPVTEGSVFYKGQYKASYSGADGVNDKGQSLVEALREHEAETVLIVGIAYDYCVKATALDLAKEGFHVSVNIAGTASVHPENNDAVTAELKDAGVEVWNKAAVL